MAILLHQRVGLHKYYFWGMFWAQRIRGMSRSDRMTVAVGFSPRDSEGRRCVAERRLKRATNAEPRSTVAPRRLLVTSDRGLKPAATFKPSLREDQAPHPPVKSVSIRPKLSLLSLPSSA